MPQSVLEALQAHGVALDAGDAEKLQGFLALLLTANEQFNLTAIKDPGDAWTKHVQDSLMLVPLVASAGANTLIDVGSGGGLPGLPLAITMPEVRMTLLEATGKKAAFLQQTAQALGLRNVTVVAERAEIAAKDPVRFRQKFDVVTSRAVGRLPALLPITAPFARAGGHIFAIKGQQASAEVAESRPLLKRMRVECVDLRKTPTSTVIVLQK
jgi:16S rRNA (guanine527-N7)-methyltransferase